MRSDLRFRQGLPVIIDTVMTMLPHEDVQLSCHLCGDAFVFSAGEQELQRLRGFEQVPTRCPQCRRRPPTQPYAPRTSR